MPMQPSTRLRTDDQQQQQQQQQQVEEEQQDQDLDLVLYGPDQQEQQLTFNSIVQDDTMSNINNNNNNNNNSTMSNSSSSNSTIPPPPPSIPESTAYWSKAPYAWSTSLDYTPPLLTSSHCASALYRLFQNTYYYSYGDIEQPNFLLAVVTESSSHPAGLDAVFAQPWMYAGPGLGSVDECPLQTCLAGGRSTDTITFAAVCTVPECSAYDLAADDFVSTVARQLEAVQFDTAAAAAEPSIRVPQETIELGREYVTLLQRIAKLNKFLQTGWTCGTFVVPFPAWPLGIPYVVLSCALVLLALIGTIKCHHSTTRRRRNRTRRRRGDQQHKQSLCCNLIPTAGSQDTSETLASSNENGSDDSSNEETVALLPQHHATYSGAQQRNGMTPSAFLMNGSETTKDATKTATSTRRSQQASSSSIFWSAFDASRHLKQLMGHNQNSTNIKNNKSQSSQRETACLDGLRVGSIVWIMLGHCMAIQSSSGAGYANPANFLPPSGLTTTVPGQLLFSSRLAVDTFLSISGFLVVYVLHSKMPLEVSTTSLSTSRPMSLWTSVFRRYLVHLPSLLLTRVVRILPLYAMCLGFYTQIAPQLGGGPFWHQWIDLLKPCHDAIWTNLLFVNNFLPFDTPTINTCFYHSWYLAVDMQLFVLAPLLVFWFQYRPRQGLGVTVLLFAASVATTAYLARARHWSVNTFDGSAVDRYDMEAYAKPHVRAQAYLAGMGVAMVLLMERRRGEPQREAGRPRYTWKHRGIMAAAVATLAVTTFLPASGAYARRPCTYGEDPLQGDDCGSLWSARTTWLYTGLSRTVWSIGIAVVLYLCVGRGGVGTSASSVKHDDADDRDDTGVTNWVASFLSWRCWTPLAHLSFGAYLIHPIVIFVWQLGDREKQTFRLLTFGMDYLSVCVVSYVAALVAAVTVEFPCAALWKNFVVVRKQGRQQGLNVFPEGTKRNGNFDENGRSATFNIDVDAVSSRDAVNGEYGSVGSMIALVGNGNESSPSSRPNDELQLNATSSKLKLLHV